MLTRRSLFFGFVALTLLGSAGCYQSRHMGVGMASHNWSNSAQDPIPGIDEGSIEMVTLKHGPAQGVKLVLWCDTASARSSGSGSMHGATAKGMFQLAGVPVAEFHCASKDGATATVEIAGQTLHSRNGQLILISTQHGKLQVKQLSIDVAGLKAPGLDPGKFADQHPEVRDFFTAARPANLAAAAEPSATATNP
jgi:hypothetical protein